MDSKLRSGIEYPLLGKITNGQLLNKEDPLTRQLFQKILKGREDECSLEWRNFKRLSGNDQLQYFVMAQELSQEELQVRCQICAEIVSILRKQFPHCVGHVFGSVANGLADLDSNVNLSVDLYGDNYKTLEVLGSKKSFKACDNLRIKIAKALKNNPNFKKSWTLDYKRWNLTKRLKEGIFRLQKYECNFTVELSFVNQLLVQTTDLLQFYLNYDPRVRHLILFIRYWAKFHGLLGNDKLTQFAINLLVLVYLTKEEIVPSIILLQTLAEMQGTKLGSPEITQDWNANFCQDLELIQKHFTPSTVHPSKEMYTKNQGRIIPCTGVEFSTVMFCPLFGTVLPKNIDAAGVNDILEKLPQTGLTDEWRMAQWNLGRDRLHVSALTIQDPFLMNANVGKSCDDGLLQKFVEASEMTLLILRSGTKSLLDTFGFCAGPQQATPTTSLPKATPSSFNITKIPNNHLPSTLDPSSTRLLFQTLLQTKQVPEKSLSANQFQNLSWNDQLLNFYQCQVLTPAELQLRKQDTDSILAILKSILPNCNAAVFGSLLTGLADSHSDIHISIYPYGDNCKTLEGCSQDERNQIILKFRQKIADFLKQARSPYNLGAFVSHLALVGKTVPLVRFKLSHTNVWVDLSIGNRMSVQNSKLILFYLNYDPRVKDIILFLRYWAKFHELSGSLKIKQYAISLLVLVYLTKEKIVPSVVLLQTLADIQRMSQGYSKTILDWDSSFCSDLKLIHDYFKPSSDHPSPQEYSCNRAKCFLDLFKGFFKLIKKTDFRNVVVCPLFGNIVHKSQFYISAIKSLEQLPQTQLTEWRKKQWHVQRGKSFFNALTIQDPFKLDFNVGRICSEENLDRFVRASKATLEILEGELGSSLDLFVKLPRIEKIMKAGQESVTPKLSQVTQVPTKPSLNTPVLPNARFSSMSQVVPVLPQTAPTSPKPSTSFCQKPALAVAPMKAISASQIPTQDHYSKDISTASLDEAHQLALEILTELGGHSTASCSSPSARKIEFPMERSFIVKYMTYLYNHEIIKLGHPFGKQQLKWQLTTLWRNLATDFLDVFFESGLNLNVKYVTTADVRTSELLNAADSQEAWEENLLDNEMFTQLNQNKSLFLSEETQEQEISEELGTKLRENLKKLVLPPQKILYKGISVQVDYPFWEKVELGKNSKRIKPFEIHVLVKLKALRNKWSECVPPTIAFVIQNGNSETNQLAINGLIAALKDQLPAYLEYQLEQWLQDGGDWNVK